MVGTHWPGCFRQSVFGRLAGYEDVNDAERLRHDPANALDCRRQSGAEERGFAESDGVDDDLSFPQPAVRHASAH
jgi:hypothetical protein